MLTTVDPAVALTRFYSWWRRTAPSAELPSTSLSTLDALDVAGPHRVCDLAARERISQPGMTALVTRLAELAQVRAMRAQELRRRLAGLTDDDRRALELAVPALQRLMSGDVA